MFFFNKIRFVIFKIVQSSGKIHDLLYNSVTFCYFNNNNNNSTRSAYERIIYYYMRGLRSRVTLILLYRCIQYNIRARYVLKYYYTFTLSKYTRVHMQSNFISFIVIPYVIIANEGWRIGLCSAAHYTGRGYG